MCTMKQCALFSIIGALALVIFTFCLVAISVLAYLYIDCKNDNQNAVPTQMTIQYDGKDAASYILQGLNRNADPCVDFYEYACGNWSYNNPTPPGHRMYDTLTKLQHGVTEKLYEAIRDIDRFNPQTPNAVKKLKYVFDSCVRMARTPDVSRLNPLLYVMQNSLVGMWPVLVPDWFKQPGMISYSGLAGLLPGQYGVPNFIKPMFSVDWKNVSQNRLYLDQASLVLGDRSVYLNNSEVTLVQYRSTIRAAAEIMAGDLNIKFPDEAVADIADIVNFEVSLAKIKSADRSFENQYNAFTIFDLKEKFPKIDWDNYLYYLLPNDVYRRVFPWVTIVLTDPEYFRKLDILLGKAPQKVVYNYLIWTLVYSRMWSLSENYRDIHTSMVETVDLRWEVSSQRVQCISLVTDFMGDAMGRVFIDKYHNHTQFNHSVSDLVYGLTKSLGKQLWRTSWMDLMSKEQAVRKLRHVQVNSGYPDLITDDGMLDYKYRNLTLKQNDRFFEVLNKLTEWKGKEEAYKLLRGSERNEFFGESPVLVNAWYSPEYNTLSLPIGLLQPPIMDPSYPSVFLYGALGTIVGHELTHGFDDAGVNFGPQGELGRWMDASSMRGFKRMTRCVISEYNNFCYPDLDTCVDGKITQGENLADNGAIRMAYYAFKESEKINKMPPIDGLDEFSSSQLFFLSYAGVWCGTPTDPEVTMQLLLRNAHPPDKVRVLGTLRNFKPFANAFKCNTHTPMVASKPCNIW